MRRYTGGHAQSTTMSTCTAPSEAVFNGVVVARRDFDVLAQAHHALAPVLFSSVGECLVEYDDTPKLEGWSVCAGDLV